MEDSVLEYEYNYSGTKFPSSSHGGRMQQDVPKLFISYSWSSPEHEAWVLQIAESLRQNGIDVLLDKWDLREGNDSISFMERMVTDPSVTHVLMISDSTYAEKADGRSGGVGTETSIISPSVYKGQDQKKFVVAIPPRKNGEDIKVPTYYTGRIYIDLGKEETFATEFERLLRWVFDKPLHVRPELGDRPAFLDSPVAHALGTSVLQRRAEDALRGGRPNSIHVLEDYFEKYASGLSIFRIEQARHIDAPLLLEAIDVTLPARNEFISVVRVVAQYGEGDEVVGRAIHRFFERCLALNEDGIPWEDYAYDPVRFLVGELFIYTIALLLSRERFGVVAYLLETVYFVPGRGSESSQGYWSLYGSLTNDRYVGQEIGKESARAYLLHERNKGSGVGYGSLMQADIVLWLRASGWSGERAWWFAVTPIYDGTRAGPMEIFARSVSKAYFTRVAPTIGAASVEAFKDPVGPWMLAIKDWRVGFSHPNFPYLLALDSIGKRA